MLLPGRGSLRHQCHRADRARGCNNKAYEDSNSAHKEPPRFIFHKNLEISNPTTDLGPKNFDGKQISRDTTPGPTCEAHISLHLLPESSVKVLFRFRHPKPRGELLRRMNNTVPTNHLCPTTTLRASQAVTKLAVYSQLYISKG